MIKESQTPLNPFWREALGLEEDLVMLGYSEDKILEALHKFYAKKEKRVNCYYNETEEYMRVLKFGVFINTL